MTLQPRTATWFLPQLLTTLTLVAVSGCALFGGPYERADHETSLKFRRINLPLRDTQVFEVTQGAFGRESHREPGNEYSWDLAVPVGTEVVAAEGGTVIDVHMPKGGAGCDPRFADAAHNLKIEHTDGTVAQYVHIEARVRRGDRVRRGEVIAVTAMNGFICAPHLHFGVYRSRQRLYDSPQRETIPLWFEQVPGGLLKKGFRVSDRFD